MKIKKLYNLQKKNNVLIIYVFESYFIKKKVLKCSENY